MCVKLRDVILTGNGWMFCWSITEHTRHWSPSHTVELLPKLGPSVKLKTWHSLSKCWSVIFTIWRSQKKCLSKLLLRRMLIKEELLEHTSAAVKCELVSEAHLHLIDLSVYLRSLSTEWIRYYHSLLVMCLFHTVRTHSLWSELWRLCPICCSIWPD